MTASITAANAQYIIYSYVYSVGIATRLAMTAAPRRLHSENEQDNYLLLLLLTRMLLLLQLL